MFINKTKELIYHNIVAIILVLVFISIYIVSLRTDDVFLYFGATSMKYLNGEYYRWFTCLFLHYNFRHLLSNSASLLLVSSLLCSILGKWKTLFLFLSGGILSEIAYSFVISEQIYGIGASSGIFALIACLIVCYLRFPKQFHLVWYRPDVIILLIYFVFANSSVSSFLVHAFGFAAGVLISFIMVVTGLIKISD
ncbi:MAG: rhomboid family intramembrane serine protease [Clostridiales bacterium]|nr:rhomboid family intramembrane serine protease [Clostridiales bacterium]